MTTRRRSPPGGDDAEIARLIARLRETEDRLRELTAGEVDAVVDAAGISHLLVAGQRALHRTAEAERNAAATIGGILDALPAHIALLDAEGTILVVNEAWRRFGAAETAVMERAGVGVNYLAVCDAATGDAGEDAQIVARGLREMLTGERSQFAYEYPCHTPTDQHWFRLIATRARVDGADGIAVMHIDITERELTDRALREHVAESRATFEHAGLGICHVAPDGRFLRVNDAYCRILGYARAELLGGGWRDITHPDDLTESDRHGLSVLTQELPQAAFEKRYLHKSGGVVWGRVTTSLVRDLEGRPGYFVSVMEDVTAQREAAERLRRLNRLYRVLSESNAAVIRSVQPQELFAEACRIAVTEGELPLAAVLLLDLDGVTVRPAAVHGEHRTYVDDLRIRLDDPVSVGGPIGVALRTGVHDICTDFATDPRVGPWRERALRIGFRSAAAFPLRRDAAVVGAFVIWTRERDYFRPDELALLDSVATNVSFALDALAQAEAQQRAEARVRESEERYRDLVENSQDIIWSIDPEGRITFINEACRKVYGYGPEELIGRSFLDFVPESQQVKDRSEVAHSLADGVAATEYESQIRRKDGGIAYLLATSRIVTDAAGKVVGVTGISKDVTDRHRADQQLSDQAALLDQANDAIILKALDDRILFWSRGAERIYGWSRAEALRATSQQLLAVDPEAYAEAKRQLLERGEWSGELTKTRRDGRRLVVDCRWSVTRDADGAAKAILAIDSDVTDRKELERQFLRAQRLENIGTLAGGIAHDLNNVFAPILLSMELLRAAYPAHDDIELLDTVEHSARRGTELVKQVLSFARGAEGPRVAIDPRRLVAEIGQVVRETFPKRITFESEAAPDLWPIKGDPTQLHQVLLNLCVNARDAMPEGGTLWMRLTNAVLDDVYAGMNPESRAGSWVMIEVRDTGVGIPPDVRERIFDPFFTTKEVGKGTGLGLSTALGIVKSHRGFMNVYSENGRGTTFKVYLPAEVSATLTAEHVVDQSALPRGNGELILLVDDEESIRDIAYRTLTRFGYRVLLAGNGAEAVAVYAQQPKEIAAVITDMAMPVMDGPATIRALRAITPGVKVIGSSGLSSNGGISRALGSGVEEFIPKPYTAGALLDALRRVVTRR